MAASEGIEKQLTEAGKKLFDPPSSAEELLPLLDQVERHLSDVEQSPSDSLQNALYSFQDALVNDKLLKHTDIDVKVAVAVCISEVTRITAPEAPYNDALMREVFQLIVSSFKDLYDNSSRSYTKRLSILDTVGKVRSCVVMLDLECDKLIIEMFQHFLSAIRDHHPENVLKSMVTIMTLVLEESEEISPELLAPLLDYVRKDKEVPHISQKLAEKVLVSSASDLKPYLAEAVKSLGLSLDKFNDVVSSICNGTIHDLNQNEAISKEKDDKPEVEEVATPEQADPPKNGSLRSEISNGVAQIAENHALADTDSTKKEDVAKDEPHKTEMDNAGNEEEIDAGDKQEQHIKEKDETESTASLNNRDDGGKTAPSSSKSLADETANASSASQSENLPKEIRSKKPVNQKKKESSSKEAKSCADSAAKVAPKAAQNSGKKVASSSKNKRKTPTKKSEPAKQQSGKKEDDKDDVQKSSKQSHGKAIDEESSHTSSGHSQKCTPKSSKGEQPLEETPKTSVKRKRDMGKDKASDEKECGENLNGARIKVWWPKDRAFYEGVVDSYDTAKKKHLVLYDDGDQEILNLKREKWEFIKDNSEPTIDEKSAQTGRDATSAMPQKKKTKMGNDQSGKKSSAKKGGEGSMSSKSKAAARKSEDEKSESKGKENSEALTATPKGSSKKKEEASKSASKTNKAEASKISSTSGKGKSGKGVWKAKGGGGGLSKGKKESDGEMESEASSKGKSSGKKRKR